MQLWDRAMAQAIAQRRKGADPPLVIGIMGSGHLRNGFGVPHQLRDLGIANPAVLLPWDADSDCNALTPDLADAVFGVAAVAQSAVQRPRLGVMLDDSSGSVVIREVVKDSVADQAGARSGDVVVTVAGAPARNAGDVIDAVRRQAPGTWLPITVRRGAESMELVARFPPTQ
jgi:S1-C subfamily serine protease